MPRSATSAPVGSCCLSTVRSGRRRPTTEAALVAAGAFEPAMTLMMEAARGLGEAPGLATSKIVFGGGDPSSGVAALGGVGVPSASPVRGAFGAVDVGLACRREGSDRVGHRRRRPHRRPRRAVASLGAAKEGGGDVLRPRNRPMKGGAAGGVALVPAGAVGGTAAARARDSSPGRSADGRGEGRRLSCAAPPRRRRPTARRRPARRLPPSRRRQCRLCRHPYDRRRPRGR